MIDERPITDWLPITKKEVEKKTSTNQEGGKMTFQDSKQKKQIQNKLSKIETEISKLACQLTK